MSRCFLELLEFQFQRNSEKTAVIYQNKKISFGQLKQQGERAGAFLREQGLKKGDVVILYTAEKLPFLILHLGIILCGGISLPLNVHFTREEMIYFIDDSGARFLFASGKQAALIREIKNENNCPKMEKIFEPSPTLERITKTNPLPGLVKGEITAEDYCFMLYSSGTTGRPKGVVHTHGNTAASLLALQRQWAFSPADVLLNTLPLFHIHGLSFASHLSLISGSTMILEDRFHPRDTMEKIKEATVFMGVPTYYYAFLNRPEFGEKAKQWQRTRLFTCGSAPIRTDVLTEIESILGKPLINRYGMTESHVIASLPLDGPFKRGSVGQPLRGIQLKIEGEKGEVKVKSRNLFHHYWNKPHATGAAFDHEGFFKTGDLGHLDEDGFLFLAGRKSDLIITGGYNVYPAVVERVINEYPGVKESAVIGIPDDMKGEKAMAVIVWEPGGPASLDMNAIKKYCREKLAGYQCPSYFETVEKLPRNTMGKVLKRELKEKFKK